ncbi:MAG: trigger factor [Alphaproteobacteria bacterium]|nr:trigger factor [Alphaproteobacteria bacterium]
MNVKVLKKEGLNHEFEVTLSAQDMDQRVEARLQEVGKTLRIDGFRPGKVPLKLLKQKYGRAVMGEVLDIAVNESTAKTLQDNNLRPALQPKIEVKQFDEGKDLTFTMAVEVLPEIKIADLKAIKLEKKVAKADDKSINEALERIAQSNSRTKPVEGNRKSKDGDTVIIDFKGRTADDNFEHPGMSGQGHPLKLGSGRFIPGFEAQLIGHKKGDSVNVKVTFPKDYGAKELAGRDAIFETEIKDLHEDAEAMLDDDFAKSLGLADMDALKKAVGEQIEKEMASQARMLVKKDLLDALDKAHQFKVPQGMLDLEYQGIVDQVQAYQKQQGNAEELSKDEQAEYKDIADRRVRLGLVLAEIGTQNNITVSDPELQRAVINEAQKYPGQERQVFDFFSKNRQALEGLRAPLFEEKVVDFILELADVKTKDITPDELRTLLEEGDEDGESSEKPKTKAKTKKAKK